MNFTLVFSALLMGLAGSVHCVAMCGATSGVVVRGCGGVRPTSSLVFFHFGRLLGYAAAGALVAGSVELLARLGQWSPALRPLWTLAHLAALGLGLWLLWKGRQPEWLDRLGREGQRQGVDGSTWQRVRGPARAGAIGAIWVAWPCGLLQSALMVAALANSPVGGAAVMAAFAAASSLALGMAPAIWLKLIAHDANKGARVTAWVTRLSGVTLVIATLWALGHDLWVRIAMYCFS